MMEPLDAIIFRLGDR